MAQWLSGCTGGTGSQVVGEPPARAPLTDLSSELLEPQGKPGWGKIGKCAGNVWAVFIEHTLDRVFQSGDSIILLRGALVRSNSGR